MIVVDPLILHNSTQPNWRVVAHILNFSRKNLHKHFLEKDRAARQLLTTTVAFSTVARFKFLPFSRDISTRSAQFRPSLIQLYCADVGKGEKTFLSAEPLSLFVWSFVWQRWWRAVYVIKCFLSLKRAENEWWLWAAAGYFTVFISVYWHHYRNGQKHPLSYIISGNTRKLYGIFSVSTTAFLRLLTGCVHGVNLYLINND